MIELNKLKRYAERLNQRADNFSAQEKVAHVILDMLDYGHCVEGIAEKLFRLSLHALLTDDDELGTLLLNAHHYIVSSRTEVRWS